MIDKKLFAIEIAKLGTAFSGGIPKEKIALYWEFLKDIPIERLRKATTKIIQSRKYSTMPTIAEIREASENISDGQLEIEAMKAWQDALRLASEMAYPYRIRDSESDMGLNNSIVGQVVKAAFGGWAGLDSSTNPEWRDQARFIEVYKNIRRSEIEREEILKELEETRKYLNEAKESKDESDEQEKLD